MSHMGHEHDDLTELGGLSADERDRLATDLQRESKAAVDRWYQPSDDVLDAIERYLKQHTQDPMGDLVQGQREHVTDGTPCWCGPTTIEGWNSDKLDELVAAAGTLHFAYHDHQAMLPDAVNKLMSLVREYDREQAKGTNKLHP